MSSPNVVAAVQTRVAKYALGTLMQYLEAIDVIGGTVVNNNGVITVGGNALTNEQYQQLYEMLF